MALCRAKPQGAREYRMVACSRAPLELTADVPGHPELRSGLSSCGPLGLSLIHQPTYLTLTEAVNILWRGWEAYLRARVRAGGDRVYLAVPVRATLLSGKYLWRFCAWFASS
jgi:hypothetical protein